jgi:hypothetical protein
MSLLKALLLGGILTIVVSEAVHGAKASSGFLQIQEVAISGQYMHWSWPLFIVSTGLAWGIMLMMR